MATMVPVQMGVTPGWYINLDLVRAIQPTNSGCVVYFDKDYSLPISAPPRVVAAAFGKQK
jgi:hypothetical protein